MFDALKFNVAMMTESGFNRLSQTILFAGIFFIMGMLAMAVGMPDTLKFYKENAAITCHIIHNFTLSIFL